MNMSEPILARVPTWRDWFQSATRRIASRLPIRPPARQRTAVAPARAAPLCRPIAAGIAREDWDPLFRSVLERLASVAVERDQTDDGAVRLQPPGTVLHECIDALDQLRRAAATDPPGRVSAAAPKEGASASRPRTK